MASLVVVNEILWVQNKFFNLHQCFLHLGVVVGSLGYPAGESDRWLFSDCCLGLGALGCLCITGLLLLLVLLVFLKFIGIALFSFRLCLATQWFQDWR